jgi:hypothetical protein
MNFAGRAAVAQQAEIKPTSPITTSTKKDIPDGALDLSSLWPSPVQAAVETDTIALGPYRA